MIDAGDSKAVKAELKTHKLKRERELEELREVLSKPIGRAVIWRVLEYCGVYRLSYTGLASSTDFREGHRDVGLWLLSEIHKANPSAYIQMQQELSI